MWNTFIVYLLFEDLILWLSHHFSGPKSVFLENSDVRWLPLPVARYTVDPFSFFIVTFNLNRLPFYTLSPAYKPGR